MHKLQDSENKNAPQLSANTQVVHCA